MTDTDTGNLDNFDPMAPTLADGNIERAADNMAQTIAQTASTWNGDVSTRGVDETARRLLNDASNSIISAAAAQRAAAEEAWKHLSDKTIYPEGRQELASKAREAGAAKAAEALREADGLIDVAIGLLVLDSAPSLGDTRSERNANQAQAEARIRMVVESDTGEGGLPDRLQNLAKLDSTISAVLTNDREFLDLLLMSRGIPAQTREVYREAIIESALEARASRGDASAKLVYQARGRLRAAWGAAKSFTGPRK